MVLRVPRTVDDRLLLEDEPFRSYFAIRKLAIGCRSRGRSPLYVEIEKSMRETTNGLDAVTAWLSTVLGPNAVINSQNIDAFVEFYWRLSFESDLLRVEACIRNVCKINKRDYYCPLSTVIGDNWVRGPVVKKKKNRRSLAKKRFRRTKDHCSADIEHEDTTLHVPALAQNDRGPSLPQPATPPIIADPGSAIIKPVESTTAMPSQNKRKAEASGVSSSDDSQGGESPLTSPQLSCIDSDTMTPLPSEYGDMQDSHPDAVSDIEPLTSSPTEISGVPPPIAKLPQRRNPSRKAANSEQLSAMMRKEYQYQKEAHRKSRKGVAITPDPEATSPPTPAPAHSAAPASVTVPSMVTARKPTYSAPLVKRAATTRNSVSANMTARKKKISTKEKVVDMVTRPTKKLKGKSIPAASRLLVEAQLFGASLLDDGATIRTRSRARDKSVVSSTIATTVSAPVQVPPKQSQKVSSKKRAREDTEPTTTGLKIRLPALSVMQARNSAPLPKNIKRRGIHAPPVPQETLGDSASAVHAIIRDSAAHAAEMLRCSGETAEEWDVEYPSDQDEYAELEREEEESPSAWLPPMEEGPEEPVYFPKIPLPHHPPIWSQSRQEVCESFNKFRSYQGGVYFRKDLVEGYLLGGFSARRDIFHHGGKLIISHGGGKAQSIRKTDGHFQTQQATDQLQNDKSVRALLRTYLQKAPVALLIDDKYKLFPFDITSKGCAYAVLGWYYIAYAWAEYQSAVNAQGRVVRYKFAFQWAEGQGEPWWNTYLGLSGDELSHVEATEGTDTETLGDKWQLCQVCRKSSPQVYEQGWMCLKPECKQFWTFSSGQCPPAALTYSESFLQPCPGFKARTDDIRPPLPVKPDEITGPTTSYHFCKGWHCTSCGRLSSRFKWEHWACSHCGKLYIVKWKIRVPSEFRHHTNAKKFDRHYVVPGSNIICAGYRNFKCDVGYASHCTFILPYNRGRIHLILTNPLSNQEADTIFREYQEQSESGQLKFRRWPLRAHKCRGTLLTNYFSQNTGEPYQYVGGTANTVSWDVAPSAVVHALDLIKRRVQQAELPCDANFNEVLSAAYMERQKMAFHSDAEKGLGPNVASLSLGASAHMYFRLHSQYAATELLPGSSRNVLQLYLRHGDILVMEGADVQNFYEHTVVPTNFRVAATARHIGGDHR